MAISKLHRHEKAEIGRKLAAPIRKDHGGDELLGPWAERLETASGSLEEAMAPRASGTATSIAATGTAAAFDLVRDDSWRALYYILLAYTTQRHDPALAAVAAELLSLLMPGRLGVAELPYARESAALDATLATAATEAPAARLAALPGVAAFVTGLAASQSNFLAAIAATPAVRAEVARVVDEIREAEASWDGVLAGYIGTLSHRFPGKKGKPAREALLKPLREAEAVEKGRTTRRRRTPSAPAGAPA